MLFRSIISLQIQNWTTSVAWQSGVLVVNSGNYYRSNLEVPAGVNITDTVYWTPSSLPDYVARTADSLQQTGVNIGVNGATPPTAITVSGIKFATDQLIDGVLVEKCTNSEFNSISVEGPLTQTELVSDADNIAAVRWSSSSSLVCTNVKFNVSNFTGFTYATATAQKIKGCQFNG